MLEMCWFYTTQLVICKEIGEKYKVHAMEVILKTKNVTFQGCYIERDGNYLVQWDDGDRDVIPLSSLDGAKKSPVSQEILVNMFRKTIPRV